MSDPCAISELADSSSTKTIRLIGLFAIFLSSAVGICIPWVTNTKNLALPTFFGTAFAAGVVLATAFVHILPDGDEAFKNPCLGLSGTYPWAAAVAGAAVMLIFSIEYFLRDFMRRKLGLPVAPDSPGTGTSLLPEISASVSSPTQSKASEDNVEVAAPLYDSGLSQQVVVPLPQTYDPKKIARAERSVAAAMLELGIVFHSVFVGIDLGIATEISTARALLIALLFHQALEGMALGASLTRAEVSGRKFLLLALVFCLITPLGVAIGLAMGSSYNDNGKVSLGFNGVFNSVSAGVLIYNGLVDLLVPIFTNNRLLSGSVFRQLIAIVLLFAGYCAMALIGKWA